MKRPPNENGVWVSVGCGTCRKRRKRASVTEKKDTNWACEEGIPYPFPCISIHVSGLQLTCRCGEYTARSLFLDISLQHPIERLTRHLAGEHETYLNLAVRPYQRRIDYTEPLRDKCKPCAYIRDAIRRVLGALAVHRRVISHDERNGHASRKATRAEDCPWPTCVRFGVPNVEDGECTLTVQFRRKP
jgi:hypothetical protein